MIKKDLRGPLLRGQNDLLTTISSPDNDNVAMNLYDIMFPAAPKNCFVPSYPMIPTETSRDVGMMDGVSDATGSCMEKPTDGKRPGTRKCIPLPSYFL